MIDALLAWPPILWTARVVTLIFLIGGGAAGGLYFLRFFRWKHIVVMWNARLPRVRKFGGKLGDNEVGIELDQDQDAQFAAVHKRIEELGVRQDVDREVIEEVVRYLLRKEAQGEFFDRSELGPPP